MMHANYHGNERYGLNYVFVILVAGLFCVAVSAQGPAPAALQPGGDQGRPAAAEPASGILESKAHESVAQELKPRAVTAPAAQAAIRVGNDVQESRLTRKVDPVMPAEAENNGIAGMVMLEITIDETGQVSAFRILLGAPLFDQAATEAVRHWQYRPTLISGQPVRVITNVVLGFGVPDKIAIDQEGNVKGPDGRLTTFDGIRQFQGTLVATPERQIAYEVLDTALKSLQAKGVQKIQLMSSDYVFLDGRLFYGYSGFSAPPPPPRPVITSAGSGTGGGVGGGIAGGAAGGVGKGIGGGVGGGVGGGISGGVGRGVAGGVTGGVQRGIVGGVVGGISSFSDVEPPELDVDLAALSAKARALGATRDLIYRVYVSEAGAIVAIDATNGPDLPEIRVALAQARVLSPGRRGNQPVPVAVFVRIPIQ